MRKYAFHAMHMKIMQTFALFPKKVEDHAKVGNHARVRIKYQQ